jgi:hypothetical protein
MFDSAEEKAAKKQAREEEQARVAAAEAARDKARADERARRAWASSPVQLEVGSHVGTASWGAASGTQAVASSAGTLRDIERVGWRLEHASHVFMVTGQTSTERVFLSGENTAVSGSMVGVYLFRNDHSVPAPPDAGPPSPAVGQG